MRTFIAKDGVEYPVGPSGFIPPSAERMARKRMSGRKKDKMRETLERIQQRNHKIKRKEAIKLKKLRLRQKKS